MWNDSKIRSFKKDYWQQQVYFEKDAINHSYFEEMDTDFLEIVSKQKYANKQIKRKTLLIHNTQLYLYSMQQLQRFFGFIPEWRFDDVMISITDTGNGVGNHKDYYDVFLIQAKGEKKWCVGNPKQTFLAQVGDLLYVPANIYHDGIATTNDSITISVGFRGPSLMEMLSMSLQQLDQLQVLNNESLRYYDPDFSEKNKDSLIPPTLELQPYQLESIQELFQTHVFTPNLMSLWFGQLMTAPKRWAPLFSQGLKKNFENSTLCLKKTQFLKVYLQKEHKLYWNPKYKKMFFLEGNRVYSFVDGSFVIIPYNLVFYSFISQGSPISSTELTKYLNSSGIASFIFFLLKWKILIRKPVLTPSHTIKQQKIPKE